MDKIRNPKRHIRNTKSREPGDFAIKAAITKVTDPVFLVSFNDQIAAAQAAQSPSAIPGL